MVRAPSEIEDQEIVAPLFGLGLPRTGSTALSFLLACDRSRRCLRTWEADAPCPPPETATEDNDPRIARCQAGIDLTHQMFPDFAGMLPSSATGPQECLLLMALDLRSHVFEGMALLPGYTAWLTSCDMGPVPLPPAGAQAPAVAVPADPLVAEEPGAHGQHRRPRRRLSRRPVRDDPPRDHQCSSLALCPERGALDAAHPRARPFGARTSRTAPLARSTRATRRFPRRRPRGPLLRHVLRRDAGRSGRRHGGPVPRVGRRARARRPYTNGQVVGGKLEERRQGKRPDPADYGLDPATLRREFAFYDDRFAR